MLWFTQADKLSKARKDANEQLSANPRSGWNCSPSGSWSWNRRRPLKTTVEGSHRRHKTASLASSCYFLVGYYSCRKTTVDLYFFCSCMHCAVVCSVAHTQRNRNPALTLSLDLLVSVSPAKQRPSRPSRRPTATLLCLRSAPSLSISRAPSLSSVPPFGTCFSFYYIVI